MATFNLWRGRSLLAAVGAVAFTSLLWVPPIAAPAAAGSFYQPTFLVSDLPGAAHTDPLLKNAWGIARGPMTPFWVADNGTGVSTLYDGLGNPFPSPKRLVVTIPAPQAGETSAPTGLVFNPTTDFSVTEGSNSGPALFVFATEDGTIAGWNFQVDPNQAVLTVDNSASGAVYKGLALGTSSAGNVLYATNFHAGTVDVFDASFTPISLAGGFVDKHAPSGYAPFGIAIVNGQVMVSFAKQNDEKHDDVAGVGNGFIDVFDLDGHFVSRFAQSGRLNSPWGMTLAPANFGAFSNALLVGNFGDGHISAFSPSGSFLGLLSDAKGQPLTIDGLWGLVFGNGLANAPTNRLFFTAGPNHEENGLFGSIQACATNRGCL
jgi:uncharacterized protein (TIGR03118 family)